MQLWTEVSFCHAVPAEGEALTGSDWHGVYVRFYFFVFISLKRRQTVCCHAAGRGWEMVVFHDCQPVNPAIRVIVAAVSAPDYRSRQVWCRRFRMRQTIISIYAVSDGENGARFHLISENNRIFCAVFKRDAKEYSCLVLFLIIEFAVLGTSAILGSSQLLNFK